MSARNWTKTLKEELGSLELHLFHRNNRSFIETGKIKGIVLSLHDRQKKDAIVCKGRMLWQKCPQITH